MLIAQHDHPDTYQEEGRQGSDVDQFGDIPDGGQAGDQGHYQPSRHDHGYRGVGAAIDPGEQWRQQTVPAHGQKDAGKPVIHDEHDRGQTGNGPRRHQAGPPRVAQAQGDIRHWRSDIEGGVRDRGGEQAGGQDIDQGADRQGCQNTDGQITLRITGLLRRGGDGIETQVGKDHQGSTADHPTPTEGHEGLPVRWIHMGQGNADEQGDGQQLDKHHGGIEAGALPYTQDEQQAEDQDDGRRRQIDQATLPRPLEQGGRQGDTHRLEGIVGVGGPADGDRRDGYRIFQDQVPTDDPGQELTESRVTVAIGTAAAADHGCQFRVGQGGEGAGQPGQDEGDDDGGPRVGSRHHARDDKNARADDCADTDQGQVYGSQDTPQPGIQQVMIGVDGFSAEKAIHGSNRNAVSGAKNRACNGGGRGRTAWLRINRWGPWINCVPGRRSWPAGA